MIFPRHFFLLYGMLIIFCYRIKAIRVIGQGTTVTVGNNAIMFCQLVETKEKLTRITWQKKTRGTPINKDFFVITPDGKTENKNGLGDRTEFIGNIQDINGTVLLKNVLLTDEGVYTCIFNIFPSGPFEAAIDLKIQAPPVVSVSTDVIPVAGDSEVTLATCTAAKALPAAGVSWRLDALSDPVKIKNIQYEDSDGTFTVKSHLIGVPSKHLNQQTVQCLVRHPGQDREVVKDYALIIHYPPQVVYIKSVTDSTTNSKEFQCVTDGNPQPTKFIWSRNQKPLSSGPDDDRLTIQLSSDNNGLYMCKVSNPYGNGTGNLYVHTFQESTTVCWAFSIIFFIILLTILGITVCFIRRRHSKKQPQKTISSIPKMNGTQNHRDSSVVEHQTFLRHAHQDQVLVSSLKVATDAESVDPGTREIITKDTRRQRSFENNDCVDPHHCVTDQRTAKEENLTISSASSAVVLCHCAHKLPDDGNNQKVKGKSKLR